jgi:DNA-binding transcriptional LysR family regulator
MGAEIMTQSLYSYDDLVLFIKVVEVGNFLHTSKILNISQPTISRRIKILEEALDVALIRRNSNSFEITEIGRDIYESFQNKFDDLNIILNQLVNKKELPRGVLRIILPPILSKQWITPFLPAFMRKYPDIQLHITYQQAEIDLIRDGFNIAIIGHLPKQQSQKIKLVASSYYKLYCSPAYKDKYGLPATPESIDDQVLITIAMNDDYTVTRLYEYTNIVTGQTGVIKLPDRLASNNAEHNLEMLYSGEVIGGLLDFQVKQFNFDKGFPKSKIIEVFPNVIIQPQRKFYILKHPHDTDVKTMLLYDYLVELLQPLHENP